MVLNNESLNAAERFQFKTQRNKDISTECVSRTVRPTIGEKKQITEDETVPFGYAD